MHVWLLPLKNPAVSPSDEQNLQKRLFRLSRLLPTSLSSFFSVSPSDTLRIPVIRCGSLSIWLHS